MGQKRKNTTKSECDWAKSQPFIVYKTSEFLGDFFPKLDVATVFPGTVFVYVDVPLDVPRQDRSGCSAGTAKKSSHPWHFRCWSPKRNELGSTNLVQCTEALHRFSSRDAIIVVSAGLEKHFDGDFSPENEKEIPFKCWPPGYQS